MACPVYALGSAPVYEATFLDADGGYCDPAAVAATVLLPDGTTAAATVTSIATGRYRIELPALVDAGIYWLQVEGSGGDCAAIDESTMLRVAESRFP